MRLASYIMAICVVALLGIGLGCDQAAYAQKRSSTTVKKEQAKAKSQVKQTQQQIQDNRRRVRQQLNELNSIQSQISQIEKEVTRLDREIGVLNGQVLRTSDSITEINKTLASLRESSSRHLRESRTRRQTMSATSMILSSENFRQAVKRAGYLKQLEKSSTKRTIALREYSEELANKKARLNALKEKQEATRKRSVSQKAKLEQSQEEGERLMAELKKQSTTLERELAERQRLAAMLDQELDKIIAEEQRIAAEQERQRKAEEEKRVAAEREKELAAAQEQAKQAETPQQPTPNAQPSKRSNKRTKAQEIAAESVKSKKSNKDNKTPSQDLAAATVPATTPKVESQKAKAPTLSFEQSKGKLAAPVAGSYNIVGKFGRSQYGNLSKVQVDNSGIDIEAQRDSHALAVYPGTVSSIFKIDGYNNIVMVRHGEYLTVYANIDKLSVKKGDTVGVGQSLGSIYADPDDNHRSILHFEVRKEREKLNPLEWIKQ